MKKRFLSLIIVLFAAAEIFCISPPLTVHAANVTNAQFIEKISQLRNTYRHGEYWNYYNSHDYSQTGKTPCPLCTKAGRSFCHWECKDKCGQFGGGGQCEGYGRLMAYKIFGDYEVLTYKKRINPQTWDYRTVSRKGNMGEIYAGDIIRLDSINSGHTIFVTKVTSTHIYYTQCNVGGNCKVTWDNVKSKSELNSRWLMIRHRKGNTCTGGNAVVTKPSAPSAVNISEQNIAMGGTITASWGQVTGATGYDVSLNCSSNSAYSQKTSVSGTSATFVTNNPGTYCISVSAKNSVGNSNGKSSASFTVHTDKMVTFKDYDGTVLETKTVKYNSTAVAPSAPGREGYTFQGWDKNLTNIINDTEITAKYMINSYTVKFVDRKGNILSKQKINYCNAAQVPENPTPEVGFVFTGWDKDDYKCVKSDLTITAVFVWENKDMPIVANITSAVRNNEASGYELSINLKNYPDSFTQGKVIAVLKTEAGKMVASETETFNLQANAVTDKSIYIPYSGIATYADVYVVGSIDDGNTGVAIAQGKSINIDLGLAWSDWSVSEPPSGDYITESRTEYRYKTKETTTSDQSSLNGWTKYDSQITSWGNWSGWQNTAVSASDTRQVQTRTVPATYQTRWTYNRSVSSNGKMSSYSTSYYPTYQSIDLDYRLSSKGTTSGHTRYGSYSGNYGTYLKDWWWNESSYQKQLTAAYTQYSYRDAIYTHYFYKWSDWSEWSEEKAEASDTKQTESRTVYRFKSNDIKTPVYNYKRYKYKDLNSGKYYYTHSTTYADSMGYPGEWEVRKEYSELTQAAVLDNGLTLYGGYGEKSWYSDEIFGGEYITYDTLEDTSGQEYTISGKTGTVGKKATLMVYKGTNTDPTASQLEYVAQTTLGNNGEYSFTFNPKEVPSLKTGDFVAILGIEGATAPIYIDTLNAPKPVYNVEFINEVGGVLSAQTIAEGESAVLPENIPIKEGYDFVGWDTGISNIHADLTIQPLFKKKTFSVVFVDWENNDISIKEFEYDEPLEGPTPADKKGSSFKGWDKVLAGTLTVKDNMVVTAEYEINKYTVSFVDWNGNIIDTQVIEYGSEATLPDDPTYENMVFAGWDNMLAAMFVSEDVTLHPIFEYTETCAVPYADKTSGNYTGKQSITLKCDTDGAAIYYYIAESGIEPDFSQIEWTEYTEPFEISNNGDLWYYASADNKNNSAYNLEEYVINGVFRAEISGSTLKRSNGKISGKLMYSVEGIGNSVKAFPIVSVTDKDGKLVYVKFGTEITLRDGENTGTVSDISFNADASVRYTFKLMFWQSLSELKPVSNFDAMDL